MLSQMVSAVLIFIALPLLVIGHDKTTIRILLDEGYPAEAHSVVTEDGYILTLHRIPHGRNQTYTAGRPVVFLQHGLLCSSADFVMAIPEKSLGMILADKGYDVWMGNFRGNTYSKKHKKWSTWNRAYWKFTWDQMAKYDLPTMINKTLEVTGQDKVHYVGHSMGTTTLMVMLNQHPHMAKKIKLANLLSPVAYMGEAKCPLKKISRFAGGIGALLNFFGRGEFLPSNFVMNILSALFCHSRSNVFCTNILFIISGFDKDQLNSTLLPTIVDHTPAGSSTYTVIHYAKEMASGGFHAMDWGRRQNMKIYGSKIPPNYYIEKVNVPTAIYWGVNDYLSDVKDVDKVIKKLPKLYDNYKISYPKWNHLDFLWGIDAERYVYRRVVENLKRFDEENP